MDKKHIFLISVFILSGSTALLLGDRNILRQETIDKKIFSQITMGGDWLLQYKDELRDPGILWIVHMINETYCHQDSLTKFIQDRFKKEFSTDPIQEGYGKLLGMQTEYKQDLTKLQTRESYYDTILLPAIYCNQEALSPTTQKEILNTSGYGYDLTHRLLALLFLKQNNCIDSRTADGVIDHMVNQIYNDLDTVGVDLYAEKIAFIEFAGYTNLINKKEIQEIVHAQQSSGGWQDPLYFGEGDNPHTTALSLWALAQYYNVCPFQ